MKPRVNLGSRAVVPNRIFLAYQWQVYRPIFERACTALHQAYPVYFYAVGRPQGQQAEALLEKIQSVILTSSAAVFDASKGNPNVSLEYGLAYFVPKLPQYLLVDQNSVPAQINAGTPIISDLAGATQNRWDLARPSTLDEHLRAIAESHEYTKRFRRYCKNRHLRGAGYKAPLKVIRLFDERDSILRRETIDELKSQWSNKTDREIEKLLRDMHDAGLITISRGREWASRISIA